MIVLSNTARAWAAYANVVRNPRFFPLWLGQLVSNLGDTLNYIALVIIVFRITGSGTALALVSIFQIVPVITVSLVAGVVIDRVSRKVIMVGADVVRGLLVLLLIVADQTNQVVLVYVAATLLAAVGSFFRPALQAIIPSLLDEDELLAANSVAWSTEQLVQIVGAAV
ncbi:MAG: MFS transporter, partial [Candidatus Chloroheliales bacterium]